MLILLLLIIFYIYSLSGRVGFTDFSAFKDCRFAHRGLHTADIPENSMWAFKNAVDNGYGAELDVHLTADEELVVIHDSSLLRTAGADLKVEDLTLKEIEKFTLENTDEKIPTLREVLNLFEGKYPIIIELKSNSNCNTLCSKVCELLKNYKGVYCIESFDPRCVYWFKKNCAEVIRGQLSENFFKSKGSNLNFAKKFIMTFLLSNFLTKPDFVAYRFKDRKNLSFRICTKFCRLQGFGWTLTSDSQLDMAEKENIIPIFEHSTKGDSL